VLVRASARVFRHCKEKINSDDIRSALIAPR